MINQNPYRPGAGLMPGYLAGRDEITKTAEDAFSALSTIVPVQSIAYVGYRGVGKTVLLNRLQEIAENDYEISGYHIEVTKSGSFIAKLSDSCRKYLRKKSISEKAKVVFENAMDALKSIEISYNPQSSEFAVSMQERALYTVTDLSQGLQDLFEAIGALAAKKHCPICFFIDEFQYASQDEMDAFTLALHRANQLAYPIAAICAGTPEMVKMLYREKTYVERLFVFPRLSMLTESEVKDALTIPGEQVPLHFSDDALTKIAEVTEGYPYFVQQFGQTVYQNVGADGVVDGAFVERVLADYYAELDNNFYMIRFEDRGALEKECMLAMAKAEKLPCDVGFVAATVGKSSKQVAPTLSRLKNKGLITYDNIADVDFTVPGFDGYLRRRFPEMFSD